MAGRPWPIADMRTYSVSLEKVHFRTMRLRYRDEEGMSEVFLEESAVPEYDWIGAEPDFELEPERLQTVLGRIREWANAKGLRIKIWPQNELGI